MLDNHFADNGNKPVPVFRDLLKSGGVKRADLIATGKERDSCIAQPQAITEHRHQALEDLRARPQRRLRCARPCCPSRYRARRLSLEQKGRLTYLAVCTGCHAFNTQLHGPSMIAIKALYQGNR